MKLSGSMKWTCCAAALVAGVVAGPGVGLAQREGGGPQGEGGGAQRGGGRGGTPQVPLTSAAHPRMQPEDAPGAAAVFGLPNQEGFYVNRTRFGPHQTSKPHYHDKDRWVTVIKGTWWTGEGDQFLPEKMVAIKTGGFMYHEANMHHWDGSCDDQEVIVQIMGYGPVRTIQTEVDAAGNPAFANPANPNRGGGGGDQRTCTR
jgi:quercetin dioxygenase-like cupin family protein